jgi:pimeloyl-ACP methyl ester carboxylesterase
MMELRTLLALSTVTLLGCTGNPVETERPPEAAYRSESVSFSSEGFTLQGTLFLPNTRSRVPAIVVVGGSGPVNRDGLYLPDPRLLPPSYKHWADRLAQRNIAVLRYDKRVITYPQIDPLKLAQEDQVRDVVAAVRYLGARPEIDLERLFIIGHSEGASLALVAAGRTRARGVVGIATLGFAVDTLVLEQLRAQPDVPASLGEEVERKFALLRQGQFPEGGDILGAGEAYWREWIHYTQKADSIVLSLTRPTLIIQGLDDENLPGSTLQKNVRVWQSTAGKSPMVQFRTYENVTHSLLQKGTQDMAGNVIDGVAEWIAAQ